jgi:hypothetical protein
MGYQVLQTTSCGGAPAWSLAGPKIPWLAPGGYFVQWCFWRKLTIVLFTAGVWVGGAALAAQNEGLPVSTIFFFVPVSLKPSRTRRRLFATSLMFNNPLSQQLITCPKEAAAMSAKTFPRFVPERITTTETFSSQEELLFCKLAVRPRYGLPAVDAVVTVWWFPALGGATDMLHTGPVTCFPKVLGFFPPVKTFSLQEEDELWRLGPSLRLAPSAEVRET